MSLIISLTRSGSFLHVIDLIRVVSLSADDLVHVFLLLVEALLHVRNGIVKFVDLARGMRVLLQATMWKTSTHLAGKSVDDAER